ncbi:MAG: AmpG family muropeptide MFS transporter [Chloroflexi bacterium]|nr:AmpG family muropeptide MFS transporter [Chloroflexota bacterium]
MIGLTALFHLPWNVKFLWGPFLDQYETKRTWILATEVALSVGLAALALVVGATPLLAAISLFVAVLAFLSATHDIAIDGYYLEALDESGQSAFVGYRAMAYKVASLVVGGPLLFAIGTVGWEVGLLIAAGIMVLLTAYHAAWLPRAEERRRPVGAALASRSGARVALFLAVLAAALVVAALVGPGVEGWGAALADGIRTLESSGVSLAGWIALLLLAVLVVAAGSLGRIRTRLAGRDSAYATAFVDFLAQRRVGLILAFIVTFRAGESFLVKMRWPFLRDDLGLTLSEYSIANGTLGVIASFVATFVGGHLIARDGLRRWIWPFVLAPNVLNLLYVVLAWLGPERTGFFALTVVIAVEQFGAGLGTAVFMVYLMRCCDPGHRAAHMAIVTALMSVSFTLAGVGSGFLAAELGFGPYFAFTFVATVPGMLLVFFLPHLDGREAPAPESGARRAGEKPVERGGSTL